MVNIEESKSVVKEEKTVKSTKTICVYVFQEKTR